MILLSNDRIGFLTTRGSTRGAGIQKLSIEAMFTDYGFILPVSKLGSEAINYLAGEQIDVEVLGVHEGAIIVDHEARMFLFGRYGGTVFMRRIMYGPGTQEAFTVESSQEQALMMALHLTDGDIRKAYALYRKAFNGRDELEVMAIHLIAAKLKLEDKTKPFEPLKGLRKTA